MILDSDLLPTFLSYLIIYFCNLFKKIEILVSVIDIGDRGFKNTNGH